MTAQPTVYVRRQTGDALIGFSSPGLEEQYAEDPSAVLAGAIERGMNIVLSTQPGLGIVTSTLEQLQKISDSVQTVDVFGIDIFALDDKLETLVHKGTEVVVVDEFQNAGSFAKEAINELISSRSLNGTTLPNLKSVVVFLKENDEVKAAGVSDLSPSVTLEWS